MAWCVLVLTVMTLGGLRAEADPRQPVPVALPFKEIAEADRVAHKTRRRLPATINQLRAIETPQGLAVSALTKSGSASLQRRWLEHRREVRGYALSVQPYSDRRLERYFPNARWHRLVAARGGRRVEGLGCVCMGEVLILPNEINLLCILEGRHLNRHNVRPLAELIVHMNDPALGGRQRVEKVVVSRNNAGEMDEVTLTTWSYQVGLRRRWTIDIREPYFYSMEEKLLAFRPEVMQELGPETLREDHVSGPSTGYERYITFWRDRTRHERMAAARAEFLEERRSRRDARGSRR
jgi:hypothetical protein